MIYTKHDYYIGMWKNNIRNGVGVCVYDTGSKYEGNYNMGEI